MADKQKIKRIISKLKEAKKKVGESKIQGIEDPKKIKPKKVKEEKVKETQHSAASSSTGPRGGSFKVTASGKKYYEGVKKSVEEYQEYLDKLEEIDRFVNKYKKFEGLM